MLLTLQSLGIDIKYRLDQNISHSQTNRRINFSENSLLCLTFKVTICTPESREQYQKFQERILVELTIYKFLITLHPKHAWFQHNKLKNGCNFWTLARVESPYIVLQIPHTSKHMFGHLICVSSLYSLEIMKQCVIKCKNVNFGCHLGF